MTYDEIAILIIILNYFGYVGVVWIKFGKLFSVSNSFYEWKEPWRWSFTIFCWLLAFPILIVEPNVYFFFCTAGLGFLGAAARIREKSVEKVHNPAAVIGIAGGLAGITFTYGLWWLALAGLVIAGIMALTNMKDKIWWMENLAFLIIITGMIIPRLNF